MSESLRPHESQHARLPCPSQLRSLLKLMPIESVMPSSHLILSRPLPLLPPIAPSIRVFSNESTLRMRWPKYWSFSFSIGPSNEHPGLISFRMDWLDLLAVQGTLKSPLQLHTIKFSILRCTIQWFLIYSQSCITITFNSKSIPFSSCPIWVIPINYHSLLPFVSPPPTSSPYQPEASNSSEITMIPDPSYMKVQISQKWL